jgi:hypothetical protein
MKQLGELKTELGQLRIQKVVSSGSKLNKMYVLFSFFLSQTRSKILTSVFSLKQPRSSQVHRSRPDRHQRQATQPAPPVLQEQALHSSRPPPQADPCHPSPPITRGQGPRAREDEEAQYPLPSAQVCRQGTILSPLPAGCLEVCGGMKR